MGLGKYPVQAVVGLAARAAALGEAGVRYLSVAHNWAGRSVPHLVGGDGLPRLFRWRGAAGHEVLVWMTDTPHGLAYAEGALLGLSESIEAADDLLPAYLGALASNPYPYGGELFGWAADQAPVDREPYPHDLLHLRVTGRLDDNTAPRRAVAEIVRDWNEKWAWPRLRMSTNLDFFEAAESSIGDAIPTLSGDWNDWWADGIGSAAQETAVQRHSQAMLPQATTVASLARLSGAAETQDHDKAGREVNASLALFDEHTWGAQDPWVEADQGPRSGGRQWHWKVGQALRAHDGVNDMLSSALHDLGDVIPPSRAALASFAVVNTCGWTRTDVVTAFLPEALVPIEVVIEVVDGRTGRTLSTDVDEPENASHHDAGRILQVLVPDVPAVGIVRIDVVAASVDADGVGPDPGEPSPVPGADSTTLSNGRLSVAVDLASANIGSIVEAGSGRELVSGESAFGFGSYVYDRYTAAGRFNHASSRLQSSERLELLGSRSLGSRAAPVLRESRATAEVLAFEYPADGARIVRTTLTLPRDAAYLDIDVHIAKDATTAKESAYLAFPFHLLDPIVRIDVAGTIVGSGIEAIPGGAPHMRAMREWVSLTDDGLAVAWTTRDAPLVHVGDLPLPFAPFPSTIEPEPATIVSWVHNNVWDTNFPAQQGFDRPFRYRVAATPPAHPDAGPVLAHRVAASASRPLLAVLARGTSAPVSAAHAMLEIESAAVELVDVVPLAQDSVLVRLRCLSDAPVTTGVRCSLPVVRARLATYLGQAGEDLKVRDGTATIDLAPRAVGALALTLG